MHQEKTKPFPLLDELQTINVYLICFDKHTSTSWLVPEVLSFLIFIPVEKVLQSKWIFIPVEKVLQSKWIFIPVEKVLQTKWIFIPVEKVLQTKWHSERISTGRADGPYWPYW